MRFSSSLSFSLQTISLLYLFHYSCQHSFFPFSPYLLLDCTSFLFGIQCYLLSIISAPFLTSLFSFSFSFLSFNAFSFCWLLPSPHLSSFSFLSLFFFLFFWSFFYGLGFFPFDSTIFSLFVCLFLLGNFSF